MRVLVKDFGCKVNQAEGEYIRNLVLAAGGTLVHAKDDAELIIINTCAVTSRTEQKIFQYIRSARKKNPSARLFISGCLGTLIKKANRALSADIDGIIPQNEKFEFIKNLFKLSSDLSIWASTDRFVEHTRAFVKIQDGCEHYCSYCIVPYLRGKELSRPIESITTQLKTLAQKGYSEIVLVGVRIGNWKGTIDGSPAKLAKLVRFISSNFPHFRIRLTSIEPWELNEELIETIINTKNVAKHLHIPLQSGSNRLLKLMRRPYTREEFLDLCQKITNAIPELAIGTDIIVGFPSETETDFKETYELVRELPLAYLHIFRYSRRPWTLASRFEPDVPGEVKSERLAELKQLGLKKKAKFIERFIGKELEVIAERKKNGLWTSHSGNYILCIFKSDENLKGRRIIVRGVKRGENSLICELIR